MHDDSKRTTLPVAREIVEAYVMDDVKLPWYIDLLNVNLENHDLTEAKRAGMASLPVIYPGFGWTNLKGRGASRATIPRLGGEFYWRQFVTAADLGVDMAYVAMFDEVDEATAIFKVSNAPPSQARFATYDGLPADWYLRLTGEGSKVIRGERRGEMELPIKP